jgi:hypothetical protein
MLSFRKIVDRGAVALFSQKQEKQKQKAEAQQISLFQNITKTEARAP